jgi:integral membrane sensor domain MASE1
MMPVMHGAIRCGRNSLPIYCLGVLLAVVGHLALLEISDGLAMQFAVSCGGILLMIAAAVLLNAMWTKSRRQARYDEAPANADFAILDPLPASAGRGKEVHRLVFTRS